MDYGIIFESLVYCIPNLRFVFPEYNVYIIVCDLSELFLWSPDMNECTESGMCPNGRCENMDGAYKCICDEGYRQSPNQQICYGMLHCSPYREKILLEFKLCNFALSELAKFKFRSS